MLVQQVLSDPMGPFVKRRNLVNLQGLGSGCVAVLLTYFVWLASEPI